MFADDQNDVGNSPIVKTCFNICNCANCGSRLVYPTEWYEVGNGAFCWEAYSRCPKCEHREFLTMDQSTADCWDEHLERGTKALEEDHKQVSLSNMGKEIEVFVKALKTDNLLPEDF